MVKKQQFKLTYLHKLEDSRIFSIIYLWKKHEYKKIKNNNHIFAIADIFFRMCI